MLAVAVLWLGRDVMTLDVVLRLILPALWLAVWTLSCVGAGWPLVKTLLKNSHNGRTPLVLIVASGAAVLALIGTILALIGLLTQTDFDLSSGDFRGGGNRRLVAP